MMNKLALRKPVTADALDKYLEEREGLELDLTDEILRSRKRAWQVACGFGGFGIFALLLAAFVIWRYCEPIAEHILWRDSSTGAIQELSILPGGKVTSYGELTDGYWVAQFVNHYTGYEFYSSQGDYDFVNLTATGALADEYKKRWNGPNAPDKQLGDSEMTTVKVNSVILDTEHGIATVRYTTTKKYRNRPEPEPTVHWIATVSYQYDKKLMTAKQRYINPAGFQVTAFRPNTEATEK